ncbi:MAG TPA: DUF2339 domain-containing protein [Polyangiaceae bacterium]|nr:DUF2339 domain-containing protein [Polyangiaceae bacterium]
MAEVLLVGLAIAVIATWVRVSNQKQRIAALEKELGLARSAYDGLVARIWHLERALADKMRGPFTGHQAPPGEAAQAQAPASVTAQDPAIAAPMAAAASPAVASEIAGAGEPIASPVVPAAAASATPIHEVMAAGSLEAAPKGAPPPALDGSQPPPATPSPPLPPAEEPEPFRIDWERWIGVRGAAALGAAVLVIAGLYFFKYSIDQGILTPTLRVILGSLTGLGCLAASELTLRKSHVVLANWLAGAGIAILYTAFWAAKALYGLIGTEVAFGLMITTTAACVALSVRHASLAVALLGLVGGFITPFALSSGSDHPIGLFGYLLLLDIALLVTARERRWPLLAALSLVFTLAYQGVWVAEHMRDRLWLGIGIVLVFSTVFGAGASILPPKDAVKGGSPWSHTPAAAVLVPFAFGVYFGIRSDLGPNLYPVGLMVTLLAAGASFVAQKSGKAWLATAAALAAMATVGAWIVTHDAGLIAWEVVGIIALLAAVFHASLEIGKLRGEAALAIAAPAAATASLGAMLLALGGGVRPESASPWPWLGAWAFLAALTLRHAGMKGREPLHVGVSIALGLGVPVLHAAHLDDPAFPSAATYLGIAAGSAVALSGLAMIRRRETARRWGNHAAALLALLLLVEPLAFPRSASPALILAASGLLGLLAALAAARLSSGVWMLLAVLATAAVQTSWAFLRTDMDRSPDIAWTALAGLSASVVFFAGWPLLASRAFRRDAWAFRAAAIAGPAYFFGLRRAFLITAGSEVIGLLPIALGFVSLAAAWRARPLWDRSDPTRRTALAWLLGVTLGFVSLAVPLQLEKEWITVGWAIEGAALIALFRRLNHPGLKYVGLAHLAVVTARLIANPGVLDYHPTSSLPVLNWIAYTYGIPALCLLAAWKMLRDIEVPRLTDLERPIYGKPIPIGARGAALAAIVVLFAWLNLAILDAFARGPELEIALEHMPARDLTMSLAWALYALALLALGMKRANAGLRWASLALVLVTAGKVFLYDLAHLGDLYRVASLVGLALSLILISIAYQRFVFGKPQMGAKPTPRSS